MHLNKYTKIESAKYFISSSAIFSSDFNLIIFLNSVNLLLTIIFHAYYYIINNFK